MSKIWNDIGLVTAGVHSHLARIASIENDSPGGGSTSTVEDEETADEKAERQEAIDRGEDDLDDDQPRKRAKDAAAYRELQSDRDRLRAENERHVQETADLRARVQSIEGERQTRSAVNERTNANLERSKVRAREMVAEIRNIPEGDPERAEKIYASMFSKLYEDLPKEAEAISQRTSKETYRQERTLDQQQADAKRDTVKALLDAGLEEDDFELVEALAVSKMQLDPGWFKRVKESEQIDTLVDIVKDRIVKTKRNSQEFRDDKKRHRAPMDGVIGEGSRSGRRGGHSQEDEAPEGPGSMLADLARNREAKRQAANTMLRQNR